MSSSLAPLTLCFFLIHSHAGRARETQVAEYPGIENERRLAHEALHRVVHGIFERMGRIIREYRSTRLAPGVKRVFVPGEMEAEPERRQRAEGVPLDEVMVQGIQDAAAGLGVDASALR
jgi:hypothetical protein